MADLIKLSKDHFGIITIIILFIFANLVFLKFNSDVWWDSAVYIGMGKYIYSLGESGFWEEFRPLVLPIILGLANIIKVDMLYFGRFVSILFSILVIFLVYKLGTRIFGRNVGLLASFFIAFSYTFIFFSQQILTEIPSTLFLLCAFYW